VTVPFSWPAAEDALPPIFSAAVGSYPVIWESQGVSRPALGGSLAAYLSLQRDDSPGLVSQDSERKVEDNPTGHAGVPPVVVFAGSGTQVVTIQGGTAASPTGAGWHGQLVCGTPGPIGTATYAWTIKNALGVTQASGTLTSASSPVSLGTTGYKAAFSGGNAVAADAHTWPTPIVGTEVLRTYSLQVEAHLRVQAYSVAVKGATFAGALLNTLRNQLETDTVRAALRAIGLYVVDRGPVHNLTGLIETRFEGRAALDLKLRLEDGAVETPTYISRANVALVVANAGVSLTSTVVVDP
jgi:hypothetical protein